MQDHDDRRGQGWQENSRGRGWRSEDDDTQEGHGYRGERRSFEPPYGDERTYGRQGQRGGNSGGSYEGGEGPGRYPRGGGSYGQGDYSPSAQRSPSREGYRYGDSGQAGQGFDANREPGAGGYGGYSGYGSSGQGQHGPGGFPRGGYGASGYGGDYGQADPSRGRGGHEGVYGEGAGRGGDQGRYGETLGQSDRPLQDYKSYAGGGGDADDRAGHHDFDPDYVEWRRNQLASYDRDYNHWRDSQARTHDEDYRRWRDERRKKFHEDFHGWRQGRSALPEAGGADPAIQAVADGEDLREADKDPGGKTTD